MCPLLPAELPYLGCSRCSSRLSMCRICFSLKVLIHRGWAKNRSVEFTTLCLFFPVFFLSKNIVMLLMESASIEVWNLRDALAEFGGHLRVQRGPLHTLTRYINKYLCFFSNFLSVFLKLRHEWWSWCSASCGWNSPHRLSPSVWEAWRGPQPLAAVDFCSPLVNWWLKLLKSSVTLGSYQRSRTEAPCISCLVKMLLCWNPPLQHSSAQCWDLRLEASGTSVCLDLNLVVVVVLV